MEVVLSTDQSKDGNVVFGEDIRASLKEAISRRQDTTRLMALNGENLEMVAKERRI